MVSVLASLPVVSLLALAACGDVPPEGNRTSHSPRVNGGPMPSGHYRVYLCSAALSSPPNDEFRRWVGEGTASFRLLRTDQGASSLWWVAGHLRDISERAAHPPIPASARIEGGRTILEWDEHGPRVTASLEWRSPAQNRAAAAFEAAEPPAGVPAGIYPYRMRGECVEDPQDSLAVMLNGNGS